MTLAQFLEPLSTTNANLIVKDFTSGNEIVNMKAAGYTNLDSSIEGGEVKSWQVGTPLPTITVVIAVAE